MAFGAVLSARDAVVLNARGVTVTAWVSQVHDHPDDKRPNSTYDLVGELGLPIPNGTVYGSPHAHAVGDRVLIRYDPEVSRPRRPRTTSTSRRTLRSPGPWTPS
ncbi:hypothetical protein [Streptomyces sp. CBMA123]|uniref:hypothetical protein n=1 Tax=Streptomyces sp. CBMA123 TaxID=1896313 RepID=UPI001661BE00|nr:hypothetical protein [Streptomyces sp. CBMA123]